MKNLIYIVITIFFVALVAFVVMAKMPTAPTKQEITVPVAAASENKTVWPMAKVENKAADQNNLSDIINIPSQEEYIYKDMNDNQVFSVGNKIPIVVFGPVSGNEECTLASYANGKKMLVTFWASWCDPCKYESPFLQKFYDQHKDYAMLTVDAEATDTKSAQKYIAANSYTFPVMYGGDHLMAKLAATNGIPKTLLVDEKGNVAAIKIGCFMDYGELEYFSGVGR